jgi:hypothetical protein
MAHAYTPGLKVTPRTVVRRARRLPLRGEVVVAVGDRVTADQVVARTDLPGKVVPLNVAGLLNALPEDVPGLMKKEEGAAITKGELLAETKGLFGFFKGRCESPIDGTIDSISKRTGQVMLREKPIPVEVRAYVDGRVAEVTPKEGALVETVAAIVQGIFGLAGERSGAIRIVAGPGESLEPKHFGEDLKGAVAVGGARLSPAAFRRAVEVGVAAVVTGGMHYRDIKELVGYEIGVAITGTEPLATTVVLTEGFGTIAMAAATHALLGSLEGRKASVNGATQIRAGVIRPEVVVPLEGEDVGAAAGDATSGIDVGSPIRVIRAPYFGRLATVTALPAPLQKVESETMVRVLEAKFEDGTVVVLPRANVELIERR